MNAAALRLLAFAACALAASAAYSAPSPEALATKSFLSRQKAEQSVYRGALKLAEQQLNLELQAIEAALKTSPDLLAAGDATFVALRDFQGSVQAAGVDAILDQADAARDALASIGGELEGEYPDDFYLSDGEPAAAFQESVASDLAKAHARVRKRVGRTRALFAKQDFALSFRIRAPRPIEQIAWSEDAPVPSAGIPATIDLIVAWSSEATNDDGQLRVAGSAPLPTIDLGANSGVDVTVITLVAVTSDRFSTDFGGATFAEGSWLVTSGGPTALVIGIR